MSPEQTPRPDESREPMPIGQILRNFEFAEDPSEAQRHAELHVLDLMSEVADLRRQKLELIARRQAGEDIDHEFEKGIDGALNSALHELEGIQGSSEQP